MSKKQDNAVVNRHVVRRLLKYGKPYIGWFLLILLIIVGTVRLELWQPELIEQASEQYVEKYMDLPNDGLVASVKELKNMRHDDLMGVLKLGGLYLISVILTFALTYAQAALLAMVGQKMQVSRVYVFENSEDNRFCYNTYEWCNQGIEPQIHNLQAVSYETDIPGYADNFDEQGIFYVQDIRRLPRNLYEILEPQGIRSLLHCAVREGGVFRGYIGFDECVAERLWTQAEIRILQYFSEVLGAFLLSYRRQQNARIQAEELNTILDNQSGWLYIIDPKTYELKFMNQKTARRAPAAAPGERCYRALMGRDKPCPGCPVAAMGGENNAAILTDGHLGIRILAEATSIRWQGEESCLLSCRKLPE
jgi:hypothetical protein